MSKEEEVGLLQMMKAIKSELPKLRSSIDSLTEEIASVKGEPIMFVGALLFDITEKLDRLTELFQWYAEQLVRKQFVKKTSSGGE